MNAADRNCLVTLWSLYFQHGGSTAMQWCYPAIQMSKMTVRSKSETFVCACWELWGDGYLMRQRGEVVQSPHMGIFSSRWFGVEWSDQQWVITCILRQFLYFMFEQCSFPYKSFDGTVHPLVKKYLLSSLVLFKVSVILEMSVLWSYGQQTAATI